MAGPVTDGVSVGCVHMGLLTPASHSHIVLQTDGRNRAASGDINVPLTSTGNRVALQFW